MKKFSLVTTLIGIFLFLNSSFATQNLINFNDVKNTPISKTNKDNTNSNDTGINKINNMAPTGVYHGVKVRHVNILPN